MTTKTTIESRDMPMEGNRETKSLINLKIRKHSDEKVEENKRSKQNIKQPSTNPSIYYQTEETLILDENMSANNDMAAALIKAFKNEEVKSILYGHCKNMIDETKIELELKITKEVEKIERTTSDQEERIVALEKMANDFEQQKRNQNVIVRGLKLSEDYTESIVKMMNIGMKITANSTDIKYVLKLNLKNEDSGTASVKVCFHDQRLRDEVYGRRLQLKGTNVYVSEDLTIQTSALAYAARQYAKSSANTTTWTMNGQVYLKDEENAKPRQINKIADLKKAPPTREF